MITKEFAEAFTQINEILNFLDESEVQKIPYDVRKKFDEFRSKEYIWHINPSKRLDEQELKKETKDILVDLYVKYWCTDEDRKEVNEILKDNYEKKHSEYRQKYNPDDIFKTKNKSKNYNQVQNTEIVQYKESLFKRIINKINKLFKK